MNTEAHETARRMLVGTVQKAQDVILAGGASFKDSCGEIAAILADMADFSQKGYEQMPAGPLDTATVEEVGRKVCETRRRK